MTKKHTYSLSSRETPQSRNRRKKVLSFMRGRSDGEKASARLAAILESSEDAIITRDTDGTITSWNAGAERLFGYKDGEAIGRRLAKLMPPGLDGDSAILKRVRHGERIIRYETIRRPKNGTLVHVSITASPIRNGQGKIIGMVGLVRDVTDRKRMETELQSWQQELESRVAQQNKQLSEVAQERKRLEAEIAGAVEAEQLRLGQELHDGLAQELAGIGMMAEVLEWKLNKISPMRAREAHRIRVRLTKLAADAQNLAKGFYPAEVERQGLRFALQEFARRTGHTFRISCSVKTDERAAGWKDARAIQLFRIAQEAIHNAAKHAKAEHVLTRLSTRNGTWTLCVKDDGVGLQRDSKTSGGMGLRVMQYRARMIGATCDVRNARDGGVIVSCSGPREAVPADI